MSRQLAGLELDETWAPPHLAGAARGEVTAVLVTSDPAELAPLARLVVAEFAACLCRAFPVPALRVVFDDAGRGARSLPCGGRLGDTGQ